MSLRLFKGSVEGAANDRLHVALSPDVWSISLVICRVLIIFQNSAKKQTPNR